MYNKKLIPLVITSILVSALPMTAHAATLPDEFSADLSQSVNEISPQASAEIPWDRDYLFTTVNGDLYVTKYNGTAKEVIAPCQHDGKPVVGFGNVVYYQSPVTSVVIPEPIKIVEEGAFFKHATVEKVEMADSVEKLTGGSVFYWCENLKDVKLSNKITEIPDYTFYVCKKLENLHISDDVKSIGRYAFSHNYVLANFNMPSKIERIGEHAFDTCTDLKRIDIRKGITELPAKVFYKCYHMEEVKFEEGSKLSSIGEHCFDGSGSKDFDIPDSVTSIGNSAFAYNTHLLSVKLPQNLTKINDSLFNGCTNIKKIYIPASVKEIGKSAFDWASLNGALQIYYGGSQSDWKNISIGEKNSDLEKAMIHYNSTVNDYRNDKPLPKPAPDNPAPEDPKPNPNPTPSGNETPVNSPKRENVDRNGTVFTYNTEIAFAGKKVKAENIGEVSISYNGQTFKASKIKINNKKKKIQIMKLDSADKAIQKELKKQTKGDSGLDFKVRAYCVSENDIIKTRLNKNNDLKSVSIKLGNKYYKCRKDEYSYDKDNKKIVFSGNNLCGEFVILN